MPTIPTPVSVPHSPVLSACSSMQLFGEVNCVSDPFALRANSAIVSLAPTYTLVPSGLIEMLSASDRPCPVTVLQSAVVGLCSWMQLLAPLS